MANINARDALRPKFMANDGRGVNIVDTADITANPTAADTVTFRLPAGFDLAKLWLHASDMDTNGAPTLAGKVGYKVNSQFAADDDAFFAAAALGQAVQRLDISPLVPLGVLQYDLDVQVTWTNAAATFAAGTITLIAQGNSAGPQ